MFKCTMPLSESDLTWPPPGIPLGMTVPRYYAEIGRQHIMRMLEQGIPFEHIRKVLGDTYLDAFYAANALGLLTPRTAGVPHMEEELVELAHFMLRWPLSGHANFNLSHGLATSLLLTDCSKLPVEDVQWPFPTFLVTLPYPDSLLYITSPKGVLAPVRWLVFHTGRGHGDDVSTRTRQASAYDAVWRRYTKDKDTLRFLAELETVRSSADLRKFTVVRLLTETGLSAFSRMPWPDEGAAVESWIGGSDIEFEGGDMYNLTDADRQATFAASRLLVNLALYVASQVRRQPELLTQEDPRRQLARRNPLTTHNLGAEIKLPKELRDAAKAFAMRGTNPTAWKLHLRHVVRGHWREQPRGTGRRLRDRIWIQPYWRGPDSVTSAERAYTVDTLVKP